MTKKPWSKADLDLLGSKLTNRQIAQKTGRTLTAVERRRARYVPGEAPAVPKAAETPTDYTEDKAAAIEGHWRTQHSALFTKYQKALKDAALVAKLVEDIQAVAPLSYNPAPPIAAKRRESKGQPQSAVLLLSDTHVGKVVSPDQTLGFGGYNFKVFLERLKYVEEAIISILDDHTNTEIPELVVGMLGDMTDGALAHGVEAGQQNTLFEQFYGAGHALAQFLRNVSAHVPKVRIYTVCGNHTRWQNQRKMPTENRFSNLDLFLYAYIEALTKDIPAIEWDLNKQPFQLFRVQGHLFHASHGDHWRGGDKALGIPNHAIGRQISTTTQLFMKNGVGAPHYYVAGHLHRSITLPHALGSIMVNGGFPGLDNYALAENFNPVDPIQRLFFVHPKYGKTACYDLALKFARFLPESPYAMPEGFQVA